MPEIIFPDVELEVIGNLRTFLAANGYPSIRVANTYTGGDCVWVRRDGGATLNALRDNARVAVNVYKAGATSQPVTDLARVVSAGMRAMADGQPIVRVTQSSGPSPIPDAAAPRQFMTFDVVVRGADL